MKGDTEETNGRKRKVIRLNHYSIRLSTLSPYDSVLPFPSLLPSLLTRELSQLPKRRRPKSPSTTLSKKKRLSRLQRAQHSCHLGHRGLQNNSTVLVKHCFVFYPCSMFTPFAEILTRAYNTNNTLSFCIFHYGQIDEGLSCDLSVIVSRAAQSLQNKICHVEKD